MTVRAKVVEDSIASNGVRLTTFQLYYPRYILAELNTHRMFSRNTSSSRAIPVKRMIEMVERDPVIPIHWGKNQKGMQAEQELNDEEIAQCLKEWLSARDDAVTHVRRLLEIGLHKQLTNRILEPWMYTNTIVTSTDWKNWFNLRAHKDAHPDIQMLAVKMRDAMNMHNPKLLQYGEWHLPYVRDYERGYTLEELKKMSTARCARVSYKTFENKDPNPLDDFRLHDMLLESRHMSPFEHLATPHELTAYIGNFRGWKQYRKEIPDEAPTE